MAFILYTAKDNMKQKRTHAFRPRLTPKNSLLHAHVWSTLTFASFITTYILSILAGARGVLPFVYGGSALFCILLLEALLRGSVWPFTDGYREKFADMDGIALRLLFFSGTLLLILESVVFIMLWL